MHQAVKEPRRILIVAPDFYPLSGGYSNAITNLVRCFLLNSNETNVTVVTLTPLGDNVELDIENLTIKRVIGFPRFIRYKAIFDQVKLGRILKKYIVSDDFYFVLFETFENPLAIWLATKSLDKDSLKKLAVRIHAATETEVFLYSERLVYRVYWYIVKRLVKRLPNILSTTQYYIEFIKRYCLDDNVFHGFKNYGVVPNIVDTIPAQDKTGAFPEGKQSYTFFALGRMNCQGYNQKNFELIAQAMFVIKMQNETLYRQIKVIIIGDGDWTNKFQATLCDLGVREQFILEQSKSHKAVRSLQAAVQAVILVSRYEGQSMFALESLAAGAPLIVSAGTGVSNLVENGKNGFLVNPDDPYSLAAAMSDLCDANVELFRAESRRLYDSHYKPDKVIEKLFSYMELCRGSAKVYASNE